MKINNLIDKGMLKVGSLSLEEKILKNDETDNDNCFEKIFCKNIIFQIKTIKISLKTLLKLFFALLSFIYIIYLLCKKGATVSSVFFLIFIYLISLLISIQFSTPSCLIIPFIDGI